jgi:hypothetical protein
LLKLDRKIKKGGENEEDQTLLTVISILTLVFAAESLAGMKWKERWMENRPVREAV